MILLYAAHGKVFRCNCYMGCLHCRIKTVQMWLQLLCCCWFVVVFFLLLLFYYSLFNSMLLLCHSLRNSSRLCVFISLMLQRWFFTLYFISRRIFSSHIYICENARALERQWKQQKTRTTFRTFAIVLLVCCFGLPTTVDGHHSHERPQIF